jgi:hypothetical protein
VWELIFAFVYLGDSLPKYVLANMRQISKNHPSYRLVFIGDNSAICKKVEKHGYEVWKSPDPEVAWKINRYSMSHNPDFRDGFWFKTLARFFALNEYLRLHSTTPTLLIESDVWLSPSFPIDTFLKSNISIAFPLTTSNQGVASTFFIRTQSDLQKFLDFAVQEVKRDSTSTDVSILANYKRANLQEVFVLPSGPSLTEAYNFGFRDIEPGLLSDNTIFANQIFDGSTWGQFFTGEDPRNSWGTRSIYHVQNHHAVNPRYFKIYFAEGAIVAEIDNERYVVQSLHVHSKDIRVFLDSNFVRRRVEGLSANEKKEIDLFVWLRMLPSRVKFHSLSFFSGQMSRIHKK